MGADANARPASGDHNWAVSLLLLSVLHNQLSVSTLLSFKCDSGPNDGKWPRRGGHTTRWPRRQLQCQVSLVHQPIESSPVAANLCCWGNAISKLRASGGSRAAGQRQGRARPRGGWRLGRRPSLCASIRRYHMPILERGGGAGVPSRLDEEPHSRCG